MYIGRLGGKHIPGGLARRTKQYSRIRGLAVCPKAGLCSFRARTVMWGGGDEVVHIKRRSVDRLVDYKGLGRALGQVTL